MLETHRIYCSMKTKTNELETPFILFALHPNVYYDIKAPGIDL